MKSAALRGARKEAEREYKQLHKAVKRMTPRKRPAVLRGWMLLRDGKPDEIYLSRKDAREMKQMRGDAFPGVWTIRLVEIRAATTPRRGRA